MSEINIKRIYQKYNIHQIYVHPRFLLNTVERVWLELLIKVTVSIHTVLPFEDDLDREGHGHGDGFYGEVYLVKQINTYLQTSKYVGSLVLSERLIIDL